MLIHEIFLALLAAFSDPFGKWSLHFTGTGPAAVAQPFIRRQEWEDRSVFIFRWLFSCENSASKNPIESYV